MNTDIKVAHTLQAMGLVILVLSDLYSLPIFWPVFGMACLTSGTYKLVSQLYKKRKSKPPLVIAPPDDFLSYAPTGYEKFRDSCRSLPKDNTSDSPSEKNR